MASFFQKVRSLPFTTPLILLGTIAALSCGGGSSHADPGGNGGGNPPPAASFSGVLMWKGDTTAKGLYSQETSLTPSNVRSESFGKLGEFQADGLLMAQPLYVRNVDMGTAGTHNLIILATEHDSIYALDADQVSAGPLWERHYLANGVTPLADDFGGRTTLGGEVGITGTPLIDSATGALYFVTTLSRNGTAEQWLRAIDIRNGNDFGPGSVQVQASVPGDGVGSANGQIAFDPSVQNQRAGLTKVAGTLLVAWGSFSDYGKYHGWLMAYDPATLQQKAVFNPTTQYQANDPVNGPSDHGGGGAFWQGGAAPAIDGNGNIYLTSADGSFNADQGGANYGDTLLKLRLNGSSFQIVDWFTPFNQACIDEADLEIGSGGVALLPTDFTNGTKMAASISKEGRFFLVNTDTLGQYNASADDQIPQEFMIGEHSCTTQIADAAEGPDWNRLYGNVSYWNGFIYAQASTLPLKQYRFENGLLNPTPLAQSPSASGLRGGNTVVSANGNQNGIVWAYEKTTQGRAVLHAYDATMVSTELWNSNMNAQRDQMGTGIGFATPVVVDGKVLATYDKSVAVYGLLP
ncbi:MAG: hypothetical protein JST79_18480 [Acidobacteria bacterium]|nr:hypothetical protein [Acidobacteriota bacterium]